MLHYTALVNFQVELFRVLPSAVTSVVPCRLDLQLVAMFPEGNNPKFLA